MNISLRSALLAMFSLASSSRSSVVSYAATTATATTTAAFSSSAMSSSSGSLGRRRRSRHGGAQPPLSSSTGCVAASSRRGRIFVSFFPRASMDDDYDDDYDHRHLSDDGRFVETDAIALEGGRAAATADVDDDDDDDDDDEEMRLQIRFEEAMRRREERRLSASSTTTTTTTTTTLPEDYRSAGGTTEVDSRSTTSGTAKNDDAEFVGIGRENSRTKYPDGRRREIIDGPRRTIANGEAARGGSRNRPESGGDERPRRTHDEPTGRRRRRDGDDLDERGDRRRYRSVDSRADDRDDGTDRIDRDDDDDDDDERAPPSLEWETYRSASVLFPPPRQDEIGRRLPHRPRAIVHFVGGTVFGSYPRRFYGSLLEDISRKCDAVVVATPIPIVLPGVGGLADRLERWMFDEGGGRDYDDDYDDDGVGGGGGRRRGRRRGRNGQGVREANPLDHSSLAMRVQTEFNSAYRDVILDEYCGGYDDYDGEVEDFMRRVPIVGIGHSLGARIQAVSCSDQRISKRCLSMGKRNRLIRTGRDGMIYLGFANWGASSSIPGVETLDNTVRKRKARRREREDRGDGVGRRDDVWDVGSRRRRRDSYNDGARGSYGRYNSYDAEDLDLMDVFGDVVSTVAEGVKQIGEALTPEAEDLEFFPTPNELWDDLSSSIGWYGRSCRNNLIVQFEDDPIDQGSRLARTLLTAYDAGLNATNSAEDNARRDETPHVVKFARLSGGHLTPVTLRGDIAKLIPRRAVSLLSSSYNFILEQIDGRKGKSSQKQRKDVEDVADTVASYIRSLNGDE